MSEKFKTYEGKFVCHECKEQVLSLRLWLDTATLSWICSKKHISRVPLIKTKKDYERKERE